MSPVKCWYEVIFVPARNLEEYLIFRCCTQALVVSPSLVTLGHCIGKVCRSQVASPAAFTETEQGFSYVAE